MFFKKKKEDVDIRELPRRNINLPNGKAFVPKDGYGFVDLTQKRRLPSEIAKEKRLLKTQSETPSAFSFFDTPTPQISQTQNSDTEELMRKVSSQISDLDSKLYKLEQRIELIERKVGLNNSSGFNW
jgi:hypothetical protein